MKQIAIFGASGLGPEVMPDGTLYVQLPLVIGHHPGPTDFWRFTREGIVHVVER